MTIVGVSANDFAGILAEAAVTVTYYAATVANDPVTGDPTVSLATGVSKSWIFYKPSSKIDLTAIGVMDTGDAYVIMPTSATLNYSDRITYGGETFEYTPTCKYAKREVGNVSMFNSYTLKKVA